jgi:hypothetical protein
LRSHEEDYIYHLRLVAYNNKTHFLVVGESMPKRIPGGTTRGSVLFVVKVFGAEKRLQRTERILKHLGASDHHTACLCQDDSISDGLDQLGFRCFSFSNQIDEQTERKAWSRGIRIKKAILRRLTNAPFAVKGYDCPECLVGVDADQFAFLATVLLVRTKFAEGGFEKVILILGEKYANAFPDTSAVCQIIAGRRLKDWARFLWKQTLPNLLP